MSEKPKIEWICLSSGVDKIMPVIKASEYKPSWIKRAAEDFKKEGSITKQVRKGEQVYVDPAFEKFKPEETRHTSKCPALQLFHNSGYIIRLHQDVIVDVAPDGNNFVVKSPEQQQQQQQHMRIITAHMEQSMYPFFENWPKDTMKKILKFNLPWAARIPKVYKLLQIHPFYQDDFRFTACSGILEPHLGHAAVGTIPVFWHNTSGETLIKAGTPLAQYILIKDGEIESKVIDYMDDKNYIKERSLNYMLLTQSFNRSYNKIREFWKRYGW